MVMESAEEIPFSKLCPFKIEKISKSLKPKTDKKNLKNGTLLIEICNKTQADKILKWKHFDIIKIKTYSYNSLNTCKGVVRSHELSLCTLYKIKTNLQDQNVMEIRRIQIKKNQKNRRNNRCKYIYNDLLTPTKFLKKLKLDTKKWM